MHCALQKLAAIFLMLKNLVLYFFVIRLHRPCQSLNVYSCTLFIRQHLRMHFNTASLRRPEARDVTISFHGQLNACHEKSKIPENNRSLAPAQTKTITEAREA